MQANGKIESCEIAKRKDGTEITGTKKDGTKYTNYKYKISGKYYSGFEPMDEYDIKLGDQVIVIYDENPNPNNADRPYKNIINITRAKDDADEQYHVKPVATPLPKTKADEPNWDEINLRKQNNITLGRIFNKTIDWIIAERALVGKGFTLDENFDKVFEHLWKKELEKRKEKLE